MSEMRYLAIQREAMEEIVGDRLLQSTAYEAGVDLSKIILGRSEDISKISPRLMMVDGQSKAGKFILCAGAKTHAFIVIDLQQSTLFDKNQAPDEAVLCLQRLLRFSIKYWDQRVLNPSENVFPGHAKAVIFPFPISQKTGYRICLDLNPDKERLSRRGQSERYLLVYKAGREDTQGPTETPSFAVFRKFIDDVRVVKLGSRPAAVSEAEISAFQNVSMSAPPGRMDIHQGYDAWMRVLTKDQRRFVESSMSAPIRIEGAAGTGKTLCLALKAVYGLRRCEELDDDNVSLFVTHSEASRRSIVTVLESMDASRFLDSVSPRRTLKVTTLQGLCADILKQDLSETELLDPDAYDAKQMQLLYVEDALRTAKAEIGTYQKFFSPEFSKFVIGEDDWVLTQMLQHEIGVVIKGRANEQFEHYKAVPALRSGMPIHSEGDKAFVWRVYELYRSQLVAGAQFDTDDVMLSALGQLATPIWRRRRSREGYDFIFIDETHLFNMNELSVFHHLTKTSERFQIAFAVDRSQAIGDRGWAEGFDIETLVPDEEQRITAPMKVSAVFRCSPDIVNLAFAITSSGASLFTNFEDPLAIANSSLSFEEERICEPPSYRDYEDDAALVKGAFERADAMVREMESSRGDVAIIAFSDELFRALASKAEVENKPAELLKERGNVELVKRAKQSGRFIISMPEYVGGLEFNGVILVGVDDGRVPPSGSLSSESRAFLNYSAHNKLYVAITRARYRAELTGVRARGPSTILGSALQTGALLRIQ